MGTSDAGGVGKNCTFSTNSWLSVDGCQQQMRRQLCSLPHRRRRIGESCLSQPAGSMDEYAGDNRTEQNLFVRSSKSET